MNQWQEWIKKNAALLLHITVGVTASILTVILYEQLTPCHLFINIVFIIILLYSAVNFVLTPQKKHWKWKCFVLTAVMIGMNRLYEYQTILELCPFLEEYSPAALGSCAILIIVSIITTIKLLQYIDWSTLLTPDEPRSPNKTRIDGRWIFIFVGLILVMTIVMVGSVWVSKHDGVSYKEVLKDVIILVAVIYAGTMGILLCIKYTGSKNKTKMVVKPVNAENQAEEDLNPGAIKSPNPEYVYPDETDEDWKEIKSAAKSKVIAIVKYLFVDLILGFFLSIVTYMKFIPEFLLEIYELIFENEESDDTVEGETAAATAESEPLAFQETEE